MTPAPSMVDARNAMLAADRMRFGGANQNELWLAFARRGFGRNAASSNTTGRPAGNENESDPLPDFAAAVGQNNATLRFVARSTEGGRIDASVFVGHHEARVSPIADTDPATNAPATALHNNLDDRSDFAPGTYEFIVTARGYGAVRFREEIGAGQFRTIRLDMAPNVASRSQGATASGDAEPVTNGTPPREIASAAAVRENLIDDTEETHWQAAATDGPDGHSVDGRQVTVDLAGTAPHQVNRVQVSALLGPVFDPGPPSSDVTQNRFTALRQFELWACNAQQSDCARDAGFSRVYESAANAFPSDAPRPVSPTLLLREFTFSATPMTHLRLVAKHSQCTGAPDYQGEQDADPHNDTDCNKDGSEATRFVRAAELQAFAGPSAVR
jgi:extracellular elastinolytic metalloproteinase